MHGEVAEDWEPVNAECVVRAVTMRCFREYSEAVWQWMDDHGKVLLRRVTYCADIDDDQLPLDECSPENATYVVVQAWVETEPEVRELCTAR